eukprot:2646677-Rhodomonas_salina.1
MARDMGSKTRACSTWAVAGASGSGLSSRACAWRGQAFGVAHLHLYGVLRARTAPSSAGGGPVEPLPPRA